MIISELIKKLEVFKSINGDLPVLAVEELEVGEIDFVELSDSNNKKAIPYSSKPSCLLLSKASMEFHRECNI